MQAPSYPKQPFLMTNLGYLALGIFVGFALAAYIAVSMQLTTKWTFAVTLGLLSPFLAILSGDLKRFFAGFMILPTPFVMFQKMLVHVEGPHVCIGIGITIKAAFLLLTFSFFGKALKLTRGQDGLWLWNGVRMIRLIDPVMRSEWA